MSAAASSKEFTGRHMLAIMLAFFGVVFVANFTMAYFAFSSWTGLVVKNSYVASQQFNETTAKLEKSAMGVAAIINYTDSQLKIALTDTAGNAVDATSVVATLGRPSHEREDQTIALSPLGGGLYGVIHKLGKGQWAGEVSAIVPSHHDWRRPVYLVVKD